jgi:heptosyltransferase II
MTSELQRLVIRAPNWLGDAVMALPAMAAIRAAYPASRLAVAAIPSIAPLFLEDTSAQPNAVVTVDGAREPSQLKEGTHEAIVLLPNSFRSAWNARRAGIGERWGFAAGFRSPLLTRRVKRPRGRLHQADYYRALVTGLGITASSELPRVRVTRRTAERAAAIFADVQVPDGASLVGLAPGAAYGHAKRWPPPRVAELIARLVRERDAVCVMVGAAGDRESGREIESLLPPGVRAVNLIGRTDLRVFAGVLARCRSFVSNDSGAMHLAAALGVPVTAIFGPTDERATAPLGDHDVLLHQVFCRPCMLRECPIDHRCMKRIGVDRVFDSVSRRLGVGA